MSHIFKEQENASPQRGLPTNETGASSLRQPVAEAAVGFVYYNGAGVQQTDAGQPAGTIVVAVLARSDIMNQLGTMTGTNLDTSLSFTSTAALNEQPFQWDEAEAHDSTSAATRASAICETLDNGDYTVDYVKGILYCKKADSSISITGVTYIVMVENVGSSGGISADVNLIEVGGSTFSLGQTVMAGSIPVVIASNQSAISVTQGANSTIIDGTGNIAATGVAEQIIVASTPSASITIQNDTLNTNDMLVGNSASQSIRLSPGMSETLAIDNANKVYVNGTIGDIWNFSGTL